MEQDRVTIQEAAHRLGLTESAIRKRITRGHLEHEKELGGKIYVYLDTSPESTDKSGNDPDESGTSPETHTSDNTVLFERMASEIDFLRRELERKDALLLNMTEVMRALEPPSTSSPRDERESPVTASEDRGDGEGSQGYPDQEQRRSWLYRFFFG